MLVRTILRKTILFFVTILAVISLLAGQSFADQLNDQDANAATTAPMSLSPLQITPDCSDSTNADAFWNVSNSNTVPVQIDWTNIDNNHTGTFSAAPGASYLTTYFDSSDNNNTTSFTDESQTSSTNATEAVCNPDPVQIPVQPVVPPAPTCIDGTIQQNLVVNYVADNEVTIHTLNNQPLCNDITIDFSSYVMPATYDQRGFYLVYNQNDPSLDVPNPTASPQSLFSNTQMVLAAGTDGTADLQIALPGACDNTQVDVYYGPEITKVGAGGHGTQNILSNIYPINTTSCQPTGTGTVPITPVTPTLPASPSTPTAPVTVPPENGQGGLGGGQTNTPVANTTPVVSTSPAELADTGQSVLLPSVLALSLLTISIGLRIVTRRSSSKF